MRSTWADSRLDELNENVVRVDKRVDALDKRVDALDKRVEHLDKRVGHLDQRVGHLDERVTELGVRMDAGFARLDGELRGLRADFGAFNRTLLQVGGGLIGTLVVGICGVIATQV